MIDHIHLKSAIGPNELESTQQHLLDVIQAGLGRPGDVSTKAAALADDIRTLGAARRDIGEARDFIGELCGVVVGVAALLPPDHPWQDTFVQTMQNVQQTDGDYHSDEEHESDEEYESDEGYASDEQLDECYEAYIHRSHYSRRLDTRRSVRVGEFQFLLCPVQD
ncbi:hypothetical protein LCI18_006534 [Fusarium solani-melongenae]|uniref:Uncharacterized protein n=1 Tax=Fusarium solani subsp. cucurbitae TaxID=2747967 RepID=A0ACD3Z2W2_FUSSC|nr:hypothetical protein LCI18_006534 [Fusarium solani-melongenae]